MESLLLLFLIFGWFFAVKNKKTKKRQKFAVNFEKTAEHMNQRSVTEINSASFPFSFHPEGAPLSPASEGETCSVQTSMEDIFRGSMPDESTEGECLCEPELEHERQKSLVSSPVYSNEIGKEPFVDLSSRGILQGVVMSEILTRPSQRLRRR